MLPNKFRINQRVLHPKFGKGIVVEIVRSNIRVNFDEYGLKLMHPNYLKITQEHANTDDKNKLITIPNSITNLDYFSREEKAVFSRFKMKITDGLLAYGTSPLADLDNRKLGFIISKYNTLLVYQVLDNNGPYIFDNVNKILEWSGRIETIKNQIKERLMEHKKLIVKVKDRKALVFPVKVVLIFQNLDYKTVKQHLNEYFNIIENNIFFKNIKVDDYIKLSEIFKATENVTTRNDFSLIKFKDQILERILPEYTTTQVVKENTVIKETYISHDISKLPKITGKERDYRIFKLDEMQLSFVNNMTKGHRLIVANAGTGKSVILLSQAFRICNASPDSKVLITCYNKQLQNKYELLARNAGFNKNNLIIRTFDSLTKYLFEKNRKYTTLEINRNRDYNIDFDEIFKECVKMQGLELIDDSFDAIFIDEVQLIDSQKLDFLYSLLKKPQLNYYFYMYGDLNQDVKNSKRKGKASWQNTKKIPSLKGRSRKLDINYRNTIQIADYANYQAKTIINRLKNSLGVSVVTEDISIISRATREGNLPIVYRLLDNSKTIAKKTVELIQEIINSENISYNDICVLYPFDNHRAIKYWAVHHLENLLNEKGIMYSKLSGDGRKMLHETEGVILSSVQSTLGLDFEYVIFYGIKPLSYFIKHVDGKSRPIFVDKFTPIMNSRYKFTISTDELIQFYSENGRLIYTACSRAKEKLYIMNDLEPSSIFLELISSNKEGHNFESRQIE